MKDLKNYILESINEDSKIDELEKKIEKVEDKAEEAQKDADKAEESIKSEEDFKDYAKNKFTEVYGDELDEDKMNEIVDGILKDYKEDADNGNWGKLIGVLNKSFGK